MEYMIILGVGILCTIAGLVAGYVLGKATSNQATEEEVAEKEEPLPLPQPKYPADAIHIWRDNTSQKIVLQIGERTIQSMDPFTNTEKKYIQQLITYLQKWIGTPDPTQTPKPATPPPAQVKPAAKVSVHKIETETPETADEAAAPKSIVAQIDAILQEKLIESPLMGRGVRLMESLDGGMTIYVGLDSYSDIADIPDNDIVAVIRASVKDWEHQQRV